VPSPHEVVAMSAGLSTISPAPHTGGVLLASLGKPGSDGALRMASLFAHRRHVPMEVLAVLEPIAPYLLIPEPREVEIDHERRDAMCRAIEQQCRRVSTGGGSAIAIDEGDAADRIVSRAVAGSAALIAMGIGRHDPVDRLLGVELTVAVLRRTATPILAAMSSLTAPLHSIAIATDFSLAADHAARLALTCAAHDATVHIIHVGPRPAPTGSDQRTWSRVYRRGVDALIDRTITSWRIPPTVRVATHIGYGDVIDVVREFTSMHWIDLIALGSHRRPMVGRFRLGSIAEHVLRTAPCSVLIAPGFTPA